MAGGNLHLPRLGSRGVVPVSTGSKSRRQPTRYAVADRKPELAGPAIETLRSSIACEPIDLADFTVPVRAVISAQPATCRYPFGRLEHLTYCGAKATVKAASALAYCDACAKRMGFDVQAWQRSKDATRPFLGGKP